MHYVLCTLAGFHFTDKLQCCISCNQRGRLVRVKKRVKKRPGQKINRNKFRHTSYLGSELMYKFLDQLDRQVNPGSIIIAVHVFIARA